ncbi:Hypothetical predicted protein [Paramuricea clavata]|uniref:Uncharacterized protein n=1 Tax=Paramuricea clavata TaxID=317549 RepID=A0A7D9EA10_PARCT|nr:Hypothetical predicted protein [Paramuricea clavata]
MDTIEMNDLNRPKGAEGGEDETVIDDTPTDEDDFLSGVDDDQRLDDVRTSSFREENKNDPYRKRKRQLDRLSTNGKFDDMKIEYVRSLFGTEYRIDPTDGRNSQEFISSLDITKNKLTFNGADVAYIDTIGTYRMTGNEKATASSRRFLNLYEKSLAEHRERAKSVVEEETGGEASGVNAEEIFEDAEEEFRQEVIHANDNLVEHARELKESGKITEQERREFAGVTVPKGPPEVRIKALREQKKVFETNIELETDLERRQIMQEVGMLPNGV